MPEEKAPSSGAFLPASLMYFCSGKPMHFYSGVDSGCAGSLQRTALRWSKFPDHWENTGKFRRSSREGGKPARFSDYKSAGYAKIPYAPEQGIFWS
jgi:hypothetical protein